MKPLDGIRVLEFDALGPIKLSGMMLHDLGADVVRIERELPEGHVSDPNDLLLRGRRRISLDLKSGPGLTTARDLARSADVVIEGSRPGVMERLGLGPETLMQDNARLVYGRLTGWGQSGPRASTAGHDINYIAVTGALATVGERGRPPVPALGLIGDMGGGAMMLLTGICAALFNRSRTGRGEVIDAAMSQGARLLMTPWYYRQISGQWVNERGSNMLDGGAPYYASYQCSDGHYIAVGAVEGKFFKQLLDGLGLGREEYGDRQDRASWPLQRELLATKFGANSRAHWDETFLDTDACVTPVYTMEELLLDRADGDFVPMGETVAPGPAPKFGNVPDPERFSLPAEVDPRQVLSEWRACWR